MVSAEIKAFLRTVSVGKKLQRGRALVSAEILGGGGGASAVLALQRGRALVSAEIRESHLLLDRGYVTSTGPRFGKRGDRATVDRDDLTPTTSTGPRFGKRGDLKLVERVACPRDDFNGAALW